MELSNKSRPMVWFQSSPVYYYVILVVSSLVWFPPGNILAAELPEDYLPHIQILEIISSSTNRSNTVNLWKERNSDIIIGEDTSAASRILMKCNATYPVQWVYLGDGRPEFTTFTNVKWQEDPNVPLSFEAEASLGLLGFQGILREEDTGNYTCRSIQEPSVHSFYYIYVPGDSLFASPNGTNITYTPQDQYIRIPCGVSHPKASVSLCKRDKNDKLNCPVSGASGFNAKGGFLINLKKHRQPSGTYVCTANYQRTVKIVEHHVMREDEKPKEPAPTPPPPTFTTKPGGKNICDPSPCGKQAECSVVNGRAVCYCFRGLSGNPYDECAPGKCRSSKECPRGKFCRQGQCTSDPCNPSPCGKGGECSLFRGQSKCSCQRGYTGLPPNCVKSCAQNEDCLEDEACIKAICQSPCPGPCGQNAECRALINGSKRTAQCSCPSGLLGDPLKICYKFNTTTPGPWNNCPPGYVGIPPSCQRRECASDLDCQFGRKCIKGICDKGTIPLCPGKCGVNAECVLSPTTSDPICVCPVGTTGNPAVQCSHPNATPTSYHNPTWGDPCKPNPCQSPAECHIIQGSRTCRCPHGFTGEPSNCFPTTASSYPTYPSSSSSGTTSGSHIFCRFDGECKPGENCVEGRCQDPCNGICGYNAICEPPYQRRYRSIFTTGKVLRSQQSEQPIASMHQCTCPIGHEGNPYVSCMPISSEPPPPPPQQVPSSPTSGDRVCFPNPCGRFAYCTPINDAPLCRCQLGFEGNPYQECRESIFSPSPSDDRTAPPPPRPTQARTTPGSQMELDYQGHSWGHHTGAGINTREPPISQSIPPGRDYYESTGESRFSSRPPPPPPMSLTGRDRTYPPPPPPSRVYDQHSPPPSTIYDYNLATPSKAYDHNAPPPSTAYDQRLPPPSRAYDQHSPPPSRAYDQHSPPPSRAYDQHSPPPSRAYDQHSPPPSTAYDQHSPPPSRAYDQHSPPPSTGYDHRDRVTGEGAYPSLYPTDNHVGDTPTPKTLDPPMSPLAPLAPPKDERDECSFKNPYADYDMESCGVGQRCERDFRGIKRCVCISPFDCSGPTSIYARNKCQSSRDCLLSDHVCMNGTCINPCSSEFSPCAGIAFSECRVIEGNVLCTCRRGYVGNPASGLDCRPKRYVLPASGSIPDDKKFILIHAGFHNSTGDFVINVSYVNKNITGSNSFNVTDYDSDNGSIINYDGSDDDDDIIISCGTSGPRTIGTTPSRHHRRHNNNIVGTSVDKMNEGHCGFGSGHNCDEKSHCRIVNDRPICVCKSGYLGEYPHCKPECEKNEDCPDSMACQYHQCMDPCIEEKSYCAKNAFCRVINHSARCECDVGYIGVPWIQCSKAEGSAPKDDCMGFNCQKRNARL